MHKPQAPHTWCPGRSNENYREDQLQAEASGGVSSQVLNSAASWRCFKGLDWVPYHPPARSYL